MNRAPLVRISEERLVEIWHSDYTEENMIQNQTEGATKVLPPGLFEQAINTALDHGLSSTHEVRKLVAPVIKRRTPKTYLNTGPRPCRMAWSTAGISPPRWN